MRRDEHLPTRCTAVKRHFEKDFFEPGNSAVFGRKMENLIKTPLGYISSSCTFSRGKVGLRKI